GARFHEGIASGRGGDASRGDPVGGDGAAVCVRCLRRGAGAVSGFLQDELTLIAAAAITEALETENLQDENVIAAFQHLAARAVGRDMAEMRRRVIELTAMALLYVHHVCDAEPEPAAEAPPG